MNKILIGIKSTQEKRIKKLLSQITAKLLDFAKFGMSSDHYPISDILHVQMVFIFAASGILLSSLFGAFYWYLGLHFVAAVIFICIIVILAALYFLGKYHWAEQVAHLMIILFLIILSVANLQLGGFDNPNDAWFMVVVVIGGLLLKRGSVWFYALITLAIILSFYLLKVSGMEFPKRLPPEQLDFISLANRIGSIITIVVLILLFRYERAMREKGLNENEQKLYQLANYDRLTDLHNRTYFAELFEHQIRQQKHGQQALLFIDLDSFKVVNDNFGHNIGDELLQRVAERFRDQLSDKDIICRHGGDEFLVMPESKGSKGGIENLCVNLINALNSSFAIKEHTLHVGCSIGVAYYPEHGHDYLSLLRAADIAMYRAKTQGSEQFQIYNDSLAKELHNKNQLALDLRKAIEQGELSLVYQPKISLTTQDVVGYEALVRWRNKNGEDIEPSVFISIAEEFSLVNKLGEWLVSSVCKQLRLWRKENQSIKKIAINISAKQLLRSDFVTEIVRITNQYDLDASVLELELTESVFIESSEDTLRKLNKLSDLGYSLVIDDYGTGYASLGYLKRFPVSGLKIDKSFIDEILDSEQDRTIVGSTIALAHELGLEIIAEGVENDAQLRLLKQLGCDILQGYYFSKPLSAEEVFQQQ